MYACTWLEYNIYICVERFTIDWDPRTYSIAYSSHSVHVTVCMSQCACHSVHVTVFRDFLFEKCAPVKLLLGKK